ncbi:MAG TPA: HAD family hydrolase, partial [Ktedonobacteraceae bacterium]|nr:HAD family hydrolase [Ktedonobacteraceae bacterium]
SEDAYWDAAGLTLHELCYSPRYWNLQKSVLSTDEQYHPMVTAKESRAVSRAMFPEDEILTLKARAINSNWDTCYVAVCMHLIDLLSMVPDLSGLLPLKPWDAEWLAIFQGQVAQRGQQAWLRSQGDREFQGDCEGMSSPPQSGRPYTSRFDLPVFKGYVGLGLINRFDLYASALLGHPIEGVFSRHSPFWTFCQIIFQEWYLGDDLFRQTYGHAPAQPGKPGCIHFERPLLPLEMVRSTLETLRQQGYVLGFATGRTYHEAIIPLDMYGLSHYFDENHISTYDHVERAEAELRARGDLTLLGKPHPFQFLLASAFYKSEHFVVVGDSTSDILGGRAAGAITVAVLTGARTPEARRLLAQSNPDFTIEDITGLPELLAQIDSLATIQHLQFAEKDKAERLLRRWFARHMKLNPESVTLTPKAVSLNSFNGLYRLDGEEYFFKTHVEEQGIVEEYYHADTLHKVGYNVVMPLQTVHEEGRQMVIYPVVRYPVMFDLARAVELGSEESNAFGMITAAEKRECERLLAIYEKTLALSKAEEHAKAPIHQLFWRRLTGGRFKHFYQGKYVPFPNGEGNSNLDKGHKGILFEELLNYRWTIYNKYGTVVVGKNSQPALGQLIERASSVLHPARETLTIIGHGDAHFGNVFLQDQKDYLYFDPAFAGRHSPLLDIVKPLFHNVYATWMYFPQEVAQNLQLSVTVRGTNIVVEHNFELTAIRQAIFDTKLASLYALLRDMLHARGGLEADWQEIVWLAMMCCPLLTINLLDEKRLPPAVCWLGLAQAIEMGVRSTDERMK